MTGSPNRGRYTTDRHLGGQCHEPLEQNIDGDDTSGRVGNEISRDTYKSDGGGHHSISRQQASESITMNTIVYILLLAAVVVAEPPSYRQNRFRSQRQEDNQGVQGDAPYPPAGYRPAKAFDLPTRQEYSPPNVYAIPADSYGAPFNTYSPPQEYGPPKEEPKDEEKEVEDVDESKKEEQKENLKEEPKKDAEVVSTQGAYYVLLPGSQLQRVQFETENDIRNMAYTARLQYKNEDRAPIFVYTLPQYQSAAYVQQF